MNIEAMRLLDKEDLISLCISYQNALKDVVDLIEDSWGVVGLNLDGSMTRWEEILIGGDREEWLGSLSDLEGIWDE